MQSCKFEHYPVYKFGHIAVNSTNNDDSWIVIDFYICRLHCAV